MEVFKLVPKMGQMLQGAGIMCNSDATAL